MGLDSLPAIWQAALLDIAANRVCSWTGTACLPGGIRTVEQLIAFGAIEYIAADARYVTLTPWGAQALLQVELFEWAEDSEPTWTRCAVVAEAVGETPLVSKGVPGCFRFPKLEMLAEKARQWYTEEVVPAPRGPLRDEWDNEIRILGGRTIYHDDDIRRARKTEKAERERKKKEARAAKRKDKVA